jgi:predicted Rossmann fold nucleotide-binding protein DprA/Smf involved in DNA uptake
MNDWQAILTTLGDGPMEPHELRRATGFSHERLYTALVQLESRGAVRITRENYCSRWELA